MKSYQLDSRLNVIGAFWPPENPDDVMTGMLSIVACRLHLLLSPTFKKLNSEAASAAARNFAMTGEARRIEALVGQTREGPCTLFYLVEAQGDVLTDFSKNIQIAGERWGVSSAVMGLQIDSAKSESIDAGAFYFTNIHEWLPSPTQMQFTEAGRSFILPSKALQIFKFQSSALEAEVICEVFSDTPSKTVPRVRITPTKPRSVDWFVPIATRLENFFTLFLGTSVSAKSVQLFRGDRDDGWFIRNKGRVRGEKTDYQAWVPHTRMVAALENWFSVPEEQRPVEKTVLGMVRKSSLFTETEFLALAQALEGFGRLRFERGLIPGDEFKAGLAKMQAHIAELWGETEIAKRCNEALNFANEASYGYRLGQTYDLLSPEFAEKLLGERASFIQKVVRTRNYFTHLGIRKQKSVLDAGTDLFLLNQQLHAFLRSVMLIDLGIPESELREPILYQGKRWKVL